MRIYRKISQTLGILLAASLIFTACSKDKEDPIVDDTEEETEVYPVEKPLAEFLSLSGLDQKSEAGSEESFHSFGIEFTPKVKGMLKAIVIDVPGIGGEPFPVVLREKGGSASSSFEVPRARGKLPSRLELSSPIILQAGKTYTLTYEGDSYYERSRNDGQVPDFPITVNNITFNTTILRYNGSGISPFIIEGGVYFYGDMDFEFQQID